MPESQGDTIIKQADTSILFEIRPLDSALAKITSGTLSMRLWHVVPTTGALETYDFNDDTFKTTAVTTATAALTHRTAENAGYNTGYWNRRHGTLTAFTVGDKYKAEFSHASMSPATVLVDFQYGGASGDDLRPTTAGRTLDVAATGEAGLDFANTNGTIGSALFAADAIDSAALAASAANEIADALLDRANAVETSVTVRQGLRALAAALAGLVSGAGSGTEVFKGIGQAAGGATRLTVTVDTDGNRSAITLNL